MSVAIAIPWDILYVVFVTLGDAVGIEDGEIRTTLLDGASILNAPYVSWCLGDFRTTSEIVIWCCHERSERINSQYRRTLKKTGYVLLRRSRRS